ncbi:MAG: agmatinase [Bacteroidota bacterium]|nr:agmatinase [Candidatus Kapabacteria bacterium]MCS7302093.1 agmatinase [Candidatus Kapabacteria bacterium]MCX7936515.1 agmatinase [Chlorobiota bacterium]MDW8074676.1 agmatinase [Bacteroidota bacterium]MDW8270848.1 agmatinase [Bacteroidota bacterium]
MLAYLETQENFLGLAPEHSSEKALIAIQPIPYERTTSYGKGTKDGPREILRASHYVEFYDDEFDRELCQEVGIATLEPLPLKKLSVVEALALIEARTRAILANHSFCVALGGEHTITAPLIRVYAEKYPNLSILQFDAHADLRNEYEGSPYSHACVMARVAEFISPQRITQVGIRALCREEAEFIRSNKVNTFFASGLRRGVYGTEWIDQVVQTLTEDVYITFDIDVLDPSIMPATGTPEPEGLSYSECIAVVRRLVERGHRIVGIDVVELAPIKKLHHANLTAARLVYKLLNVAFSYEQLKPPVRSPKSRRTTQRQA